MLHHLTAFDLRNGAGTQIVKHPWTYDDLGRKGASAGITVAENLEGWTMSKLDFNYDGIGRWFHRLRASIATIRGRSIRIGFECGS